MALGKTIEEQSMNVIKYWTDIKYDVEFPSFERVHE